MPSLLFIRWFLIRRQWLSCITVNTPNQPYRVTVWLPVLSAVAPTPRHWPSLSNDYPRLFCVLQRRPRGVPSTSLSATAGNAWPSITPATGSRSVRTAVTRPLSSTAQMVSTAWNTLTPEHSTEHRTHGFRNTAQSTWHTDPRTGYNVHNTQTHGLQNRAQSTLPTNPRTEHSGTPEQSTAGPQNRAQSTWHRDPRTDTWHTEPRTKHRTHEPQERAQNTALSTEHRTEFRANKTWIPEQGGYRAQSTQTQNRALRRLQTPPQRRLHNTEHGTE